MDLGGSRFSGTPGRSSATCTLPVTESPGVIVTPAAGLSVKAITTTAAATPTSRITLVNAIACLAPNLIPCSSTWTFAQGAKLTLQHYLV